MKLMAYIALHHPFMYPVFDRLPSLDEIRKRDDLTEKECWEIIFHELHHLMYGKEMNKSEKDDLE